MTTGVRGESIKYHTVVVICAAFLVAIWPLPGTMLVRNLLLLIGLMVAVPVIKNHISLFKSSTAWPIYVLFTFFVWLGVHYQFFAGNRAEQWNEMISYWPRTLIACVLGLALGMVLTAAHNTTRELRLQTLLIVGFSGTVVIFCIRYVYEIYRTGQWLHHDFYMTPYLGKTPLVIFGSIFLPLVLIKILDALKGREHWRWYIFGLLGISATLLTYFFGNTKNGFAIFALLLGFFFFLGAIQSLLKTNQSPFSKGAGLALVLVSLLAFGLAGKKHLESNSAWANLVADIKVSMQTDQHHYWKDKVSPLPHNEYGQTVNGSTHERTAWAKASLELLSEQPMGYGQINHSFGAMAIKKWTDFHPPDGINRGSSHSGWLDFALGFGVIGILLVWVPLVASFWRARHGSHFWQRYAFWTIPVIGFTYLTTEVCTGHFIELLFFMTAMFCGLTLKKSDAPSA